ncbi:MAG: hypothetical protein ACRD3J_07250 [Thermoanaerobaculia bacterium]
MFKYDRLKEASRRAKHEDHCGSNGPVFQLGSLIADGLIRNPNDRSRTLTAGASVGKLIYAVDQNFAIHVGFDGVRGTPGAVKHETLFHNADVRAAGELEVEAGVIVEVGDISGTYGTPGMIQIDPLFAEAVLIALDDIDAPVEPSERRRLERRARRQ